MNLGLLPPPRDGSPGEVGQSCACSSFWGSGCRRTLCICVHLLRPRGLLHFLPGSGFQLVGSSVPPTPSCQGSARTQTQIPPPRRGEQVLGGRQASGKASRGGGGGGHRSWGRRGEGPPAKAEGCWARRGWREGRRGWCGGCWARGPKAGFLGPPSFPSVPGPCWGSSVCCGDDPNVGPCQRRTAPYP